MSGAKCLLIEPLKSGDPSDVYRPHFHNIPHLGKLSHLESIIYSRIKRSINHVIISEQHGFRSQK